MNASECEKVMCAALARLDGESPALSEKETLDHLANCQRCREELDALTAALQPLDEQQRQAFEHDLWPEIEAVLPSPTQTRAERRVSILFGLFGLFLLAAKVLEVFPECVSGLVIKLISLVATVCFFCMLRQNPFRVRADLVLSGTKPPLTNTLLEVSHVSSLS